MTTPSPTSSSAPAGPVDRPRRVLWLVKGLGPGGAENLILLAARHRDRDLARYRLAHLTPWKDALVAPIAAEGVPVSCLSSGRWWDPRWLGRLRHLLRTDPVDVVHVHSPVVAIGTRLVVRTLPRSARPRVVTTEHNVWNSHHAVTRTLDRLTFPLDDAHLAVSEAVRRSIPPRLAASVEVVLHGVDLDDVRSHADRAGVRAELGIADHEVVIGTVANLRAPKAYPDLLRAARMVLDEVPEARFVSVGQGPLADEIAALHAELDLGDRFLLLGYRDDAARVASGFDVFCLASHHEGLPVAMMEALALGVPVVATDVGGVAEVVTDGVEGLLVPPARPDLLARALVGVATDPRLRGDLADAAGKRGDTLSVDDALRRTEAVYLALAGR